MIFTGIQRGFIFITIHIFYSLIHNLYIREWECKQMQPWKWSKGKKDTYLIKGNTLEMLIYENY